MSTSADDPELAALVRDLVRTLRQLEAEFEPRTESGRPRPPSPGELLRFTSDVGIPAAILLLRANVEALKLLQRALRLADGRAPTVGSRSPPVRERAERVSSATLSRLDGALADLQDAVEGRPEDDDARDLLAEARELRADVEARLDDEFDGEGRDSAEDAHDSVPVDVDAELRSIRSEFDGADGTAGNDTDGGDDAGPTDAGESPDGGPAAGENSANDGTGPGEP